MVMAGHAEEAMEIANPSLIISCSPLNFTAASLSGIKLFSSSKSTAGK